MYSKTLRSLRQVQAFVMRVTLAGDNPSSALRLRRHMSCVQGSRYTTGRRHRPRSSSSWGLGAAARTSEGSIRQPGAWEGWCSQIERRHGICMVQSGLLNAYKNAFVADMRGIVTSMRLHAGCRSSSRTSQCESALYSLFLMSSHSQCS